MKRHKIRNRVERLDPFYTGWVLHPTKGWRRPSVRSAHATAITYEVRRGLRPFSSLALHDVLKAEGII